MDNLDPRYLVDLSSTALVILVVARLISSFERVSIEVVKLLANSNPCPPFAPCEESEKQLKHDAIAPADISQI